MNKKSSRKITFFTFVFTIVIVVYHAKLDYLLEIDLVNNVAPWILRLHSCLATIAMSFFFMTSGFLLYYNVTPENIVDKLFRRVYSLLVPLTVWNLIYMPVILILEAGSFRIRGLLDVLYHFTFDSFNGPLWYLFAIFLLAVLAVPTVKLAFKNIRYFFLIVIIISTISISVFSFNLLGMWGFSEEEHIIMWITRLCRYLPSYFLGSYLGLYNKKSIEFDLKGLKKTTIVFLLFIMFVYWYVGIYCPNIVRHIIITFYPFFIWLIIDNSLFENELIPWIKGSFMIYALHKMVIMGVRFIIKRIITVNTNSIIALVTWLIFPFFIIICAYWLSIGFTWFLKRWKFYRLLSVLTGNRS